MAFSAIPFLFVRPRHCRRNGESLQARLFLAGVSITCLGYLAALACIAIAMTMVATETALYKAGLQPVEFIPFTQALRWMMFLTLAPLVLEQLFAATGRTLDKFLHPEDHA